MKAFAPVILFVLALPQPLVSQSSLTVYNQEFAVVRDHVLLDLKTGENVVPYVGVTAQLEPDSVILRDPTGRVPIQILEQSYRADTLSPGYMLQVNEGKSIDFLVKDKDNKEYTIKGKIIRSGYDPSGGRGSPIIEVNGQLRFSLPGEPIFPAIADGAILKPTLTWRLAASNPAKFDAELSYITKGMNWFAAYNLVAPEKGDTMELTGWVTLLNNSGKEFVNAKVKLMAGNVNKLPHTDPISRAAIFAGNLVGQPGRQGSQERAFDEFHLYALPESVSLRDLETKQVEFIRAPKVTTTTVYIYDGAVASNFQGWNNQGGNRDPSYGTALNKTVWVMREFKNTGDNGLGLPLPMGRVRFYRQDSKDNSVQFVGENVLDHTPEGEMVRLYTGDAFDLVGERKRLNFQQDGREQWLVESFEIKVRNHKQEPVEVRVVEHLYRGRDWEIIEKSEPFTQLNASVIEFRVNLKPDEEKVVTYAVRYTWR